MFSVGRVESSFWELEIILVLRRKRGKLVEEESGPEEKRELFI